jgi:hypothetical protein
LRGNGWTPVNALCGCDPLATPGLDSVCNAGLRGLTESVANGFRVEVCGVPGPRMRGTGGTHICGLEISRDRGHPPATVPALLGCYREGQRQKQPQVPVRLRSRLRSPLRAGFRLRPAALRMTDLWGSGRLGRLRIDRSAARSKFPFENLWTGS